MTDNMTTPAGVEPGEGRSASHYQQVRTENEYTTGRQSRAPKAETFPYGSEPLRLGPKTLPWAQERITKLPGGRPVPDYGIAQWHALDDANPRKWAAALIEAEASRAYRDPSEVAMRLRLGIEAARDAQRGPDAVEAGARQAMARDDQLAKHAVQLANRGVQQFMRGESYAELSEKRGEPMRAERARFHERRMDTEITRHHPVGRTA